MRTRPGPAMEKVAGVFESYAPSENETHTEEGLVKSVLRILWRDFKVKCILSGYLAFKGVKGAGFLFACPLPREERFFEDQANGHARYRFGHGAGFVTSPGGVRPGAAAARPNEGEPKHEINESRTGPALGSSVNRANPRVTACLL